MENVTANDFLENLERETKILRGGKCCSSQSVADKIDHGIFYNGMSS